jgi:hypothetical protein
LTDFDEEAEMTDCKYFDGCSAPLCPRDEGVADRTWFPGHSIEPQGEGSPLDEDICRLADVPDWVKRQKKVSLKAAQGGYFTLAMLQHDCRISKGMKGIDPDGTDKERAADEAAWFTAHPVITQGEREKYKATAEKLNAKSLGFQGRKGINPCALNGVPEEKGSLIPPAQK